jgi:ubiquinone/menaquinone biosynthesis C-methylase UbiE
VDCERAFIAQRYDRIAGLIGVFDRLFFLPPHLRRRAAARLDLKPGDRVLEIGCGTGRNFPFLREAVGGAAKSTASISRPVCCAGREHCAGASNGPTSS